MIKTTKNKPVFFETKKTEHLNVIDFLKGIAIIAVVIDHLYHILYENPSIQKLSFYSVTLFIFLSGITAYLSMEAKNINNYNYNYVLKRLRNLLIPYVIAIILSQCITSRFFNFNIFLKDLISFKTWGPYYFIVFFLQLIFISPILYLFLKKINKQKYKIILNILSFIIIVFLSFIFTKYTFITNLYGGGKFAFGGSYLIIFYLGLLFASFKIKLNTLKQTIISSFIFLILTSVFLVLYTQNHHLIISLSNFLNIWKLNPPGIVLIIYATLIFGFFGSTYCLFEKILSKKNMRIFKPIEIFGKYSIIVFLYHSLMIFIYNNYLVFKFHILIENSLIHKTSLLIFAIIIPVMVKIFFDKVKTLINKKYFIVI